MTISSENILAILSAAGFTSFGGAYLINKLVSKGIEEAVKHNFDLKLEAYKNEFNKKMEHLRFTLRNSETFFSHQLSALTDLRKFSRAILPRKRNPEMDFYDACWELATNFNKHADYLDDYLSKYEAVLPNDALKIIEKAAITANEGSFEFFVTEENEPEVTKRGIETAEEFYEMIKEAAKILQKSIDSQVEGRE